MIIIRHVRDIYFFFHSYHIVAVRDVLTRTCADAVLRVVNARARPAPTWTYVYYNISHGPREGRVGRNRKKKNRSVEGALSYTRRTGDLYKMCFFFFFLFLPPYK